MSTTEPWEVAPPSQRRWAILTGGSLGNSEGKLAHGVLRYGADPVAAVIDHVHAGRSAAGVWPAARRAFPVSGEAGPVPVVASLAQALELRSTSLLLGMAPAGGRIPADLRPLVVAAVEAGLEVVSGMHTLLRDDPDLVGRARASGARLWDVRIPTSPTPLWSGRFAHIRSRVIATVGTDSAIGKMTASLELVAAARRREVAARFVATGQTGIIISGRGIPADHVLSDFLSGAVEQELVALDRESGGSAVLVVEGQGAISHPAYSAVTLGLLHGSAPEAIVLCHEYGHQGDPDFPDWEMPPPAEVRGLYESLASFVRPAAVVAVSLNTRQIPEDESARLACQALGEELGLPCDDPVRFGADRLWEALMAALPAAGAEPAR